MTTETAGRDHRKPPVGSENWAKVRATVAEYAEEFPHEGDPDFDEWHEHFREGLFDMGVTSEREGRPQLDSDDFAEVFFEGRARKIKAGVVRAAVRHLSAVPHLITVACPTYAPVSADVGADNLLLVGAAGSGKTAMLQLLAYGVAANPGVADALIINARPGDFSAGDGVTVVADSDSYGMPDHAAVRDALLGVVEELHRRERLLRDGSKEELRPLYVIVDDINAFMGLSRPRVPYGAVDGPEVDEAEETILSCLAEIAASDDFSRIRLVGATQSHLGSGRGEAWPALMDHIPQRVFLGTAFKRAHLDALFGPMGRKYSGLLSGPHAGVGGCIGPDGAFENFAAYLTPE